MTIQQPTELTHAAMLGLGVYRPERVVTNDEICEVLDSSDEWIQTRSGIKTRRFAGDGETLIGMSTAAAERALAAAGVAPAQVGCVIVATSTHPEHTPASAPQVATALGLDAAAAFDISAGCAGFCHALNLASSMVRSGAEQHVLVIGVEQLSRFMDPTDRGTAFIFADGAGAVVVGPADATGIGPTAWGSDGSQSHVITQTPSCLGGHSEVDPVVQMEGTAVFRWAPFAMAEVAHEALRLAGIGVDDLDAFIPHQANLRITQTLSRNIKLPESVAIATDVIDSGNTSAASVPLAMEAMLRQDEASVGDTALLIAFGAGLSYAGQVVTLPPLGQ
ncbi:3-oxoacyl-[acyl-carrier-protein] synthase-3/beta-ketoacyl ACP synthase [Nocardioides alpinus]|uniref:Beta-ketoacyl-[acyl-carrier-protein] synthase III n=1 Tax=Nocardioides alpinus TaxID=748909 RepID=A0A1I1A3Y1_9ACTN|nr:beta-ketoacyl-ACP synthase III [Nocardioides alpinus]PKH42112.1 ketoacyl-ACP synthase III [Nocardioides alpinus]SFB32734.1 3-oxoacyl-[acyl-carrier-protein] synthase-3/beta-ketoacyl ACP synthase [Nocardioides alpinus]